VEEIKTDSANYKYNPKQDGKFKTVINNFLPCLDAAPIGNVYQSAWKKFWTEELIIHHMVGYAVTRKLYHTPAKQLGLTTANEDVGKSDIYDKILKMAKLQQWCSDYEVTQ
jgi:hypothetical protein